MADDLSGWMRAVRPDTAADENWTESAEAAEVLAAVHSRGTGRSRRRARLWVWAPAPLLAAAATVAVLVATAGGSGTPGAPQAGGPPLAVLPGARPAAQLLSNFNSCGDLLSGLRAHAAAHPTLALEPTQPYLYYRSAALTHGGVAYSSGAGSLAPTTATPTNTQEVGVDEPDLVKTSDGRIITITDGVLRVVDPSTSSVIAAVDLTMYAGADSAQLLVGDGHAVVVLNDAANGSYELTGPYARTPGRSTLVFVDLASATVTGTLRLPGTYVGARQIGSTVRLVARSAPSFTLPSTNSFVAPGNTGRLSIAQKQGIIGSAPLSAWLPRYQLTVAGHTTGHTVPCDQVSHPAAYTGASLLTIYTLHFADLTADPQPVTLAADSDTVYATPTSLYVASNPSWFAPRTSGQRTEIHRFDIRGTDRPVYLGSGSVTGRLLSSYSLSDYNGSLRIATTQGGFDGSEGDSNSVVVLDADTLRQTGRVDGLGTNERIYAVRFLGPVGYVVTYHETDPLYTLDLHDPAHPRVVSSLLLSGYSSYLHDAGDGRLIGVGQLTSNGQVRALQVSLFDVSSPAHPSRVARVVLPGTPGESDFDPHTFLYEPDSGLVVVPVQTWSNGQAGHVLVLHLGGRSLRQVGTLANPAGTSSTDDGLGIQHSMVVNGRLWTISGSGVLISDPATLHRVAWVPFDAP